MPSPQQHAIEVLQRARRLKYFAGTFLATSTNFGSSSIAREICGGIRLRGTILQYAKSWRKNFIVEGKAMLDAVIERYIE